MVNLDIDTILMYESYRKMLEIMLSGPPFYEYRFANYGIYKVVQFMDARHIKAHSSMPSSCGNMIYRHMALQLFKHHDIAINILVLIRFYFSSRLNQWKMISTEVEKKKKNVCNDIVGGVVITYYSAQTVLLKRAFALNPHLPAFPITI